MLSYAEFLVKHPIYLLIASLVFGIASIIALLIEVKRSRKIKR